MVGAKRIKYICRNHQGSPDILFKSFNLLEVSIETAIFGGSKNGHEETLSLGRVWFPSCPSASTLSEASCRRKRNSLTILTSEQAKENRLESGHLHSARLLYIYG